MKPFSVLVAAFVLSLYGAGSAHADPLTLSGSLTVTGPLGPQVGAHLITDEFDLTTGSADVAFIGSSCLPCLPGPVNAYTGVNPGLVAVASGTILGKSYDSVFWDGFLQMNGPIQLPQGRPGDTITISAPFTASGRLNFGLSGADVIVSHNFYIANVTGGGTAVFTLRAEPFFPASGPAHWDFLGATYSFGSAAAPTPEPLTVLLVATGMGLAGARYRRPQV